MSHAVICVEIDAWNLAGERSETLRFASQDLASGPADDPANAWYEGRLSGSLSIETSLFAGGALGSASQVGVGSLELVNADGGLDHLLDSYALAGRPVRVYRVGRTAAQDSRDLDFSGRELLFAGAADAPEFSFDTLRLPVRDPIARFKQGVQPAVYRGDGLAGAGATVEGDASLLGRPKPLALGRCLNLTPVQVDPQRLVYQIHDRAIAAVDQVYDAGATLRANLVRNGDFAQGEAFWWLLGHAAVDENGCAFDDGDLSVLTQSLPVLEDAEYAFRCFCRVSAVGGTAQERRITVFLGTRQLGSFEIDDVFEGELACQGACGLTSTLQIQFGPALECLALENVELAPVTLDHADAEALVAAPVPPGGFATCLTQGLFRLGSSPCGQVTADVRGDAVDEEPLVLNGDFRAWQGDAPAGWVLEGGAVEPWSDADDGPTLRLVPSVSSGGTVVLRQDCLLAEPAVAGLELVLSLSLRSEAKPAPVVRLRVLALDGSGAPGAELLAVEPPLLAAWRRRGLNVAVPQGCAGVRVQVELEGAGSLDLAGLELSRSAYVADLAGLLRRLARRADVSAADMDQAGLDALAAACPGEVGLFLAASTELREVLDRLCTGLAVWSFTPDGRFSARPLADPTGLDARLLVDLDDCLDADLLPPPESGWPPWRVELGYGRNNTVQESQEQLPGVWVSDALVGVVSPERRAWLAQALRSVTASDQAVRQARLLSRPLTVDTVLHATADATAQAALLLELYARSRLRLRLVLPAETLAEVLDPEQGRLALGDAVRVSGARFGLAQGRTMLVTALNLDYAVDGVDTATLEVWG